MGSQTAPVTSRSDVAVATEGLRSAGLAVVGWIVGLHSTPLATAHPDLALRNVFGHVYRHALCPAQPAVRRYAAALVAERAFFCRVFGIEPAGEPLLPLEIENLR